MECESTRCKCSFDDDKQEFVGIIVRVRCNVMVHTVKKIIRFLLSSSCHQFPGVKTNYTFQLTRKVDLSFLFKILTLRCSEIMVLHFHIGVWINQEAIVKNVFRNGYVLLVCFSFALFII
jgi:hypothetical protein